jgi:DNA-binding transcriptional MerR regulator
MISFNSVTMKLEELAKQSGVSARTVRYYVQRGLLPAPEFRGRDTTYNEVHLHRLKAIRKLQERFLPLDAIETELKRSSAEEIRKLGEGVQESKRESKAHPYREPVQLVPRAEATEWVRWEILPGLEIHVSDRANAMTRSLAEELRAYAERRATGGSK